MSLQSHLSAFADHAARAAGIACPRYAVSLVDRHSGKPHRISGIPLVLMTCEPHATVHDLMRHRDPDRWDTTIEPLGRKGAFR